MNIGDVSERSGLPVKTIRYYEDIGLIRPDRSANGYRHFDEIELHKLRFLGRARSLGFGLESCRELLSLYQDSASSPDDVRAIAARHLRSMEQKLAELQSMTRTLQHLVRSCERGGRPDCPILEDLTVSSEYHEAGAYAVHDNANNA